MAQYEIVGRQHESSRGAVRDFGWRSALSAAISRPLAVSQALASEVVKATEFIIIH